VLADQAMHTHFRWLYARFEELTQYPKFCHGLGQFHRNPRELLDTPPDSGLVTSAALADVIPDGMRLFVDELVDFSERHMPELVPAHFFQTLLEDPDVQIPLLIPMLEPAVRRQPAWIAYGNLWSAVAAKFPTLNLTPLFDSTNPQRNLL